MISGTGHKISISNETQYGNHCFESLDSDMIIIKWMKNNKRSINKLTSF